MRKESCSRRQSEIPKGKDSSKYNMNYEGPLIALATFVFQK